MLIGRMANATVEMAAVRRSNTQRQHSQLIASAASPLASATERSRTTEGGSQRCSRASGPTSSGFSGLPVGVCQSAACAVQHPPRLDAVPSLVAVDAGDVSQRVAAKPNGRQHQGHGVESRDSG